MAGELALVGTGGFQAAPSHEQKDHRAVEFVARAKIRGGPLLEGLKVG